MIGMAQDGAILRLTLNRPEKKNALTPEMYHVLAAAFEGADASGTTVILIEGQAGIFCAGNDLTSFLTGSEDAFAPVLSFLRALVRNRLPVVAAVDGPAIGIGTTLLLHCDHVIASARSVFATPFVDLGLVPEAASSLLAPLIMGHQRAFELLAMGRRFSAVEAEQAGFVSTVIADEDVALHALGIARKLAAKPRDALLISRALMRPDPAELLSRIEKEATLFAERLASPEAQAAIQAFLGKTAS